MKIRRWRVEKRARPQSWCFVRCAAGTSIEDGTPAWYPGKYTHRGGGDDIPLPN
jgi:hypothetical protein